MNIKITKEENKTIAFLSGTIDIPSADSLKKSLHELLETPVEEIVLDFSEVESVGSSAIGALLLAHKEYTARGIKFSLVNINKEISALFKIIKLDKLFHLHKVP